MDLKELLKAKSVTQIELANRLNVTQSLISQWVRGMCSPNPFQLRKLAEVLDIGIEEAVDCFSRKGFSDGTIQPIQKT